MAAPTGTDRSLTTPIRYTVRAADFGFADADGNAFSQVRIATLPTTGTLFYDSNGSNGGGRSVVTVGQQISVVDILNGRLTFAASGTSGSSFTFQVQDNSGAGNLDLSPNTLTFSITASGAVTALFSTTLSLSGLAATDGFKIQGESAASVTGSGVAGGDINGDGFSDLIIGASNNTGANGNRTGAAYVVFGRPTGFAQVNLNALTATTGFKIIGQGEYDQAGGGVASAGDINGDGFADILIGASQNRTGGVGVGAVYVIFGKASGFGTINLNTLAAADGFKITGQGAGDNLGRSVSSAGDINGDGLADIIIGADGNEGGGSNRGAAYVIFGKTSGFGTINLNTLAAADGFRIAGEASSDYLGRGVSSAGDVNGDGFDDLLVGAYGNDSAGRTDNGAAYVIFGRATSFGTVVAVSGLTATTGFKILGEGASNRDYTGFDVSSAGDVNGDGFADILIGKNDYQSSSTKVGAAWVVFGRSTGIGTIDLNGITAANGFRITGQAAGDFAGRTVSAAGDVNGDGFADILIGAGTNDGNGSNAGTAYLIFGRATGFGPIDLNSLGSAGVRILGEAAEDNAGNSISAAGDVNGDGFADLIVGATGNDSGGANAGAAYVIFGRSNVTNTAPTIATNTGSTVAEGGTDTITGTELAASDGQQAATALIYTVTTAATNGTLRLNGAAVVLNGTFTQADINNGLVTYLHNGGETTSASFGFSVSDGAGGSVTGQTFSFTVTPVDDAPVAVADTPATPENVVLTGSITTNDTDVDAGPRTVASVNGVGGNVGTQFALASGALLTVQANGSYSYNPNGAFNFLVVSGSPTGGQSSATDSFTYALNGGSSATVTVTINGVTGAGDQIRGTPGNNTLNGTAGNDVFYINQGGSDTISTNGGSDGIFVGTALDSTDRITGSTGAGIDNQVIIQGNYTATLTGPVLTNIQTLAIQPGNDARWGDASGALYSYAITLADNQNVAAGATLTVNANRLRTGENLSFNGAAETDGSFRFFAASGNDVLIGGGQADQFYGRLGADTLTGNGGADTFFYRAAAESIVGSRDTITDFTNGDRIDLSFLDANAFNGAGTNEAFSFVGAAAFSGGGGPGAGQLRAVNTGGANWTIEADLDGNGTVDFSLLVVTTGGHAIVATDFIL